MPTSSRASFVRPQAVSLNARSRTEIIRLGGAEIGRHTFEPGWQRSRDGDASRSAAMRYQYHVTGRLAIRLADGSECVAGPGDVVALEDGHDAWVVGSDPVVVIDWAVAPTIDEEPAG